MFCSAAIRTSAAIGTVASRASARSGHAPAARVPAACGAGEQHAERGGREGHRERHPEVGPGRPQPGGDEREREQQPAGLPRRRSTARPAGSRRAPASVPRWIESSSHSPPVGSTAAAAHAWSTPISRASGSRAGRRARRSAAGGEQHPPRPAVERRPQLVGEPDPPGRRRPRGSHLERDARHREDEERRREGGEGAVVVAPEQPREQDGEDHGDAVGGELGSGKAGRGCGVAVEGRQASQRRDRTATRARYRPRPMASGRRGSRALLAAARSRRPSRPGPREPATSSTRTRSPRRRSEPEARGPAPRAPASGGEASAPAPAPAPDPAPQAGAAQQLPYTGADVEIVLAAGTALLAGGVALRIRPSGLASGELRPTARSGGR